MSIADPAAPRERSHAPAICAPWVMWLVIVIHVTAPRRGTDVPQAQ